MAQKTIDVLIIGAGASGAAAAWSLAETRMHIVCLEQGDWMKQADYPTNRKDWEEQVSNKFHINPNRRSRYADYPINEDNSPIKVANFNAVGGGTILYSGHFPRLHPSDFRVKTLDGVADDWPIDYGTLEPFYEENDRMTGVSGLAGDPAYPPKQSPLPPVPLGLTGERLGNAFNKLGWHWWVSDSAVATQPYDGRDKCLNLGACGAACAQGAKASTDITYWPHAVRNRVEVWTGCRVREVTVNNNGLASGVIYYDKDGVEQALKAHIVILACNGIGTPRLLLNSTSNRFPDGLANNSGLVGKNFMFHPYAHIRAVFDEPLDGYRGPENCVWSHEFYETDLSRGFVRGFIFECTRGLGPVATASYGMTTDWIPWDEGHHDGYRQLFDRVAGIYAVCEDLPEEHNRITLDPILCDNHGIPAPKIDYTLSENSRRMLEFSVERARDLIQAAGGREWFTESPLSLGGWHLLGTARMGSDPQNSVINEWGRSHDVRNLFIVDGSLFVTAGGVNPTRTIQSLALYVADSIKKRLATLFDD